MVREEKRESFNVECGDIVRVPAGTPVYMINRDENEKLFIVKILQPVSVPDHFEVNLMFLDSFSFSNKMKWRLLDFHTHAF